MANEEKDFSISVSMTSSLVLQNETTLFIARLNPTYFGNGAVATSDAFQDIQFQLDRPLLTVDGPADVLDFSRLAGSFSGINEEVDLTISKLADPGDYHIIGATVHETNGRITQLDGSDLTGIGPTTITLLPATAPKLSGFVVSNSGHSLTIAADVSDPNASITSILISLDRDIAVKGALEHIGYHAPPTVISDGIYHLPQVDLINTNYGFTPIYDAYGSYTRFNLPEAYFNVEGSGDQHMTQIPVDPSSFGHYGITSISIVDINGGTTNYTADQLHALGFTTDFGIKAGTAADYKGDGHSNILWQSQSGAISVWLPTSSGSTDAITQAFYNYQVAPSWTPVESFDWNGDLSADLLWRNKDGGLSIWTAIGYGRGFQQASYNDASVGLEWQVAGAADLNGDGKADILWRNQDGSLSTWQSTGSGFQKDVYHHAPVDQTWKVEGVGDFSSDGRADILWRNTDGAVSSWNSNGNGFDEGSTYVKGVSISWHVVGIGDFNGDGADDVVWRNDNGSLSVWQGGRTGFVQNTMNASAGTDWKVVQVGDFNADGMSDLLWRNSAGSTSIWHSTGSGWLQNTYFDSSVGNDWKVSSHDFPII